MYLRNKNFTVYISYPSLCLFSVIVMLSSDYFYCLVAVLFHESAHLAAMKLMKLEVKGVSVTAFDIRIIEGSRRLSCFSKDFFIAAAGPLINILMFLAFYLTDERFAWVNLCIGLFNMLPAADLDGGQMLYLVLSRKLSDRKAALTVDIVTIILSIPLFLFGIILLFESKYNFSLLFISLYLILSLFIKEDRYL